MIFNSHNSNPVRLQKQHLYFDKYTAEELKTIITVAGILLILMIIFVWVAMHMGLQMDPYYNGGMV